MKDTLWNTFKILLFSKDKKSNTAKKIPIPIEEKENESFQDKAKRLIEKNMSITTKEEYITMAVLSSALIHILLSVVMFINRFTKLEPKIISNNPIYIIIMTIPPLIAWVKATDMKFMAFKDIKTAWFKVILANIVITCLQPVYSIVYRLTIRPVFSIKTNPVLTPGMILLLEYVVILVIMAIFLCILKVSTETLVESYEIWDRIEYFKLKHVVDTRKDKENKYDLKVMKNLNTGKDENIKENDRFVHGVVNGASGTGKTSTIFITGIASDLYIDFINRKERLKKIAELIVEGCVTIQGPLTEFDENAVIPCGKTESEKKKNEKKLQKIKRRYTQCGTTVVAPNAGVVTDVIKLAAAVHRNVQILDPINDYSIYPNAKVVGINPFYLPLGLDEEERVIQISSAASVFSDVLIAVNENGGSSDTYFRDIALAVSSNISTVVMLAKNIRGEQAYINDIQMCINNFSLLRDYVTEIETYFGIKVEEASLATTKNIKATKNITADEMNWEEGTTANAKEIKQKTAQNPYLQQLIFIKTELLGAGAEKMFDQARGLRNLINKLLTDPRIKKMLSADEEHRIDFDRMLKDNEITLVNTAIELSKSVSTAVGLFFILLQRNSIFRRPPSTRSNHFLWIDEASQYMHPAYEDMFALYRQYRVAIIMAIQSLSQTAQKSSTAYIKDVMMGAGTHIVFGRLSPEEMELYSKMAGTKKELVEQSQVTQSSIFAENPQYSEGIRGGYQQVNIQEGSDLRMRDFQEVSIFTIDEGRVLEGKPGRVFFIDDSAFEEKKLPSIDWRSLVPSAFEQKTTNNSIHTKNPGVQEDKMIYTDVTAAEKIMSHTIETKVAMNTLNDESTAADTENWYISNKLSDDEGIEEVVENDCEEETVNNNELLNIFKGMFFEVEDAASIDENDDIRKALEKYEKK